MAKHVERPLIFPLSNPTERIEAVPADVINWTDGSGLVGTGTPWGPVTYNGVSYEIGQDGRSNGSAEGGAGRAPPGGVPDRGRSTGFEPATP